MKKEKQDGKKEEQQENKAVQGLTFTRLFGAWLHNQKATLVLAADLPGGLCIIGRQKEGKILFQQIGQGDMRAVATAPDGTIWSAEKNFLWRWENITESGGYKLKDVRLYVPRLRIYTSNLGTEDISVDGNNKLLMASGAYSVIGRATPEASFELVWKPSFITKIARENRCGLSGVGLYDKERHCASVWGMSDEPDGWKKDFNGGGRVLLLHDGSTCCEGLCLPRAPRWAADTLYVLNTGTAELGRVDAATKSFVPVCRCPGYPTGMAILRNWAVISVSALPPHGTEDLDLPAREALAASKTVPLSGVVLVDLRSGDIAHHAYSEAEGVRVNDVAVLPNCPIAMAMAPENARLDNLVTLPKRRPTKAAAKKEEKSES